MQGIQVLSLVGELRCHILCGIAEKTSYKNKNLKISPMTIQRRTDLFGISPNFITLITQVHWACLSFPKGVPLLSPCHQRADSFCSLLCASKWEASRAAWTKRAELTFTPFPGHKSHQPPPPTALTHPSSVYTKLAPEGLASCLRRTPVQEDTVGFLTLVSCSWTI